MRDRKREKVFKELEQVRFGNVISYQELSRRAFGKQCPRAIGRLLASNRDYIAIPCHRVIRKNGSPGGYALGREFKEFILKWEKTIVS
jgi:O-6-methylguanine DNA methyltransferase